MITIIAYFAFTCGTLVIFEENLLILPTKCTRLKLSNFLNIYIAFSILGKIIITEILRGWGGGGHNFTASSLHTEMTKIDLNEILLYRHTTKCIIS